MVITKKQPILAGSQYPKYAERQTFTRMVLFATVVCSIQCFLSHGSTKDCGIHSELHIVGKNVSQRKGLKLQAYRTVAESD